MRTQLVELEQENSLLQEETESYNLLLQNKTTSGTFMSDTQLMQRLNDETGVSSTSSIPQGVGVGVSTLGDELAADGGKKDLNDTGVDFESPTEKQLRSEVRALTLYIEKILGKVKGNPQLEAILISKKTNLYGKENDDDEGRDSAEDELKPAPPSSPQTLTMKNRMSLLAQFPVSAAAMAANAAVEMVRSVSKRTSTPITPASPVATGI
ncbi:UNVERIFIED_CONTAM: hypothetical protein HDU68_012683 [Siphonaria sp. JEL0065]|nr:hypothetical protein HDU68_012683 [Siphonaria sp. JEL0065]